MIENTEKLENSGKSIAKKNEAQKFIAKVYGWMFFALIVSGLSAIFTVSSQVMLNFIFGNRYVFYAFIIAEIVMVFILSAAIQKMSAQAAFFFFFLYSVINGITLSIIFLVFDITSIVSVFFISAGMFGGMTLYGMKTSQDLSSAGRYLMMTLIGLIIGTVVNLLLKSSFIDWLITLISLVVFIGLTAYDTQKMKKASEMADGSEVFKKAAIIGALELYLDFINIFLHLLNLFGGKRK